MKKDNIRNIAFLLLLTVSLFSYSYLSCVSQHTTSKNTATIKEPTKEVTIYIPDITFVNNIIRLGRKMIASQP